MSVIESEYSIKNEYQYPIEENHTYENYIGKRLIAQIEWYDKKSIIYQKRYKQLMLVSFILSAFIPVLTLLMELDFGFLIRIIIIALSSSVTVISSILTLYGFKDLWIQYRSNCEMLKSILHRYKTKTGEFISGSESDDFKLLVITCEEYMIKEFKNWGSLYNNKNQSSTDS